MNSNWLIPSVFSQNTAVSGTGQDAKFDVPCAALGLRPSGTFVETLLATSLLPAYMTFGCFVLSAKT